MRISDWSSDVCSSDLHAFQPQGLQIRADHPAHEQRAVVPTVFRPMNASIEPQRQAIDRRGAFAGIAVRSAVALLARRRSEEHTSELQSLMRISYAVFCLKKKKNT